MLARALAETRDGWHLQAGTRGSGLDARSLVAVHCLQTFVIVDATHFSFGGLNRARAAADIGHLGVLAPGF